MKTQPSCGPLYAEARAAFAVETLEATRLFAAGFVCGEAEKVHLGACRAAMFRPAPENEAMLVEVVTTACRIYGLGFFRIEYDGRIEVWIGRGIAKKFWRLTGRKPDSRAWHWLRGRWCGIPWRRIDLRFHLRRGATARCD